MMKIITYNVNGLRAAVSKGLPEWQSARGKYYNHRKESGSDETSATPAHTSESLPATPF